MTNKKGFWEIKIRKVENGYICSWEDEGEEKDYFRKGQKVFEEIEDDNCSELKNMKEVLLFIKEYFGINYSKHNEKNLVVEIHKGEKNEPNDRIG